MGQGDSSRGQRAQATEWAHGISPEQRELLERVAAGEALPDYLERIVLLIERLTEGAIATILLLDRDGVHVRHGAAPSAPESFVRAIDGVTIGPHEGSCGAAAYLRERVIVEDIATHPNWKDYKALALPVGLRACWSSPIFSTKGEVLGTFAIYYGVPRAPTASEIDAVDLATHLAALAIERARADEDLRSSEQRYRQIFDTVADVVFHVAVDAEGEFRFSGVNPAFTHATGIPAAAVVGQRVRDVIPPESIDQVLAGYRRAIAERCTVRWEEVSTYPTGVKHGSASISPIFDADGHCSTLVGTVHDTTEVHDLQAQFQRMQRLESLGTMASGIAHDFNNILMAMVAHLDLAREAGDGAADFHEALSEIEVAIQRAGELTKRVLSFGRESEPVRRPIDPSRPVREAVDLLRASIRPPITLVVELPEVAPLVVADATSLHQVLVNLATNAVQAVGDGAGRVVVTLETATLHAPRVVATGTLSRGDYVVLTVRDDGEGMSEGVVERMFDPYFTTKEDGGTGLGLWVVHGLVTKHQGAIEVVSTPGGGTTICVYFPVVGAAAVQASAVV